MMLLLCLPVSPQEGEAPRHRHEHHPSGEFGRVMFRILIDKVAVEVSGILPSAGQVCCTVRLCRSRISNKEPAQYVIQEI